jgi:antitoxin (DNA-binding transcriptional repressor) of toxin-antitoxin stability system
MTKDVTIAELQNDLPGHLAAVSDGVTIRVLDKGEAVAQIGPSETDDDFFVHVPDPALGRLGDWTPPSLHLDWDPVPDLIAERDKYR